MGDSLTYSAAATNNSMDATMARAQSRQARNQAYASAYKLESDATAGLTLTGDNLMRMQRNKTASLAAHRAEQANSGFLHSGSKLAAEQSLAEILDLAIADQMQSASQAAASAYSQANLNRQQGDTQLAMGNIQSDFYTQLAAANRSYSQAAFLGQALQYPADIYFKYNLGSHLGSLFPAKPKPTSTPSN